MIRNEVVVGGGFDSTFGLKIAKKCVSTEKWIKRDLCHCPVESLCVETSLEEIPPKATPRGIGFEVVEDVVLVSLQGFESLQVRVAFGGKYDEDFSRVTTFQNRLSGEFVLSGCRVQRTTALRTRVCQFNSVVQGIK